MLKCFPSCIALLLPFGGGDDSRFLYWYDFHHYLMVFCWNISCYWNVYVVKVILIWCARSTLLYVCHAELYILSVKNVPVWDEYLWSDYPNCYSEIKPKSITDFAIRIRVAGTGEFLRYSVQPCVCIFIRSIYGRQTQSPLILKQVCFDRVIWLQRLRAGHPPRTGAE